ncbi:MAG: hypothetical protein LBC02_07630 [Planctomycetaceae bacterium]|jgi:tetratricopeptide (TPR) repeat protein|nr:hypothetical protein [Planctomycetaceae bacterium]
MTLDPYSLCPGGREKKIRFCCPDMIKEIGQIEQMLETDQNSACLTFIDTLEKDHPNCACLTEAKLSVYRKENKWGEILQLAKNFYENEPENPIATAEYALALAITGIDLKFAVNIMINGFECFQKGVAHGSLINVMMQIAVCLLKRGFILPVIAICTQLKHFPSAQDAANELLLLASSKIEIPILLRDTLFIDFCPDHFPGKKEFDEAAELIGLMHWKKGLEKLESLTQYDHAWSAIWRNVAAVRFWLFDEVGGCDALRKFAALPNTPLEDAADAEATCLLMTENSLGDQIQSLYFEYEIKNAKTVYEKLLSNPLFLSFQLNKTPDPNTPPVKGSFLLIDRPLITSETSLTLENISSRLAIIIVFGKQTNQEARMVVTDLLTSDQLRVEQIIKETFENDITNLITRRQIQNVSATQSMVDVKFVYPVQTFEQWETMKKIIVVYYEQVFINRWCKLPLGMLNGKTPTEAAKDPAYKIRLLGAIQIIENWIDEEIADQIANQLREKLGLPTYNTITIPVTTAKTVEEEEKQLLALNNYPIWRWHRFEVEKLPTVFLVEGLQIAAALKRQRIIKKFALEILNRPAGTMLINYRALAYELLIELEQETNHFETALEWIEKAKQETAQTDLSGVSFLLNELAIRFALQHFAQANELIREILTKYGKDEEVLRALQMILVRFGALNHDGSLSETFQNNAAQKSNKLWTPETTTKSETHTKLWTPNEG